MSQWDERDTDPGEGVRIIGPDEAAKLSDRGRTRRERSRSPEEEEADMSRRDPYEGDEDASWGTFAGQEPRWRDDEQGEPRRPAGGYDPRQEYVEPTPGRSVFGDEAPVAPDPYEEDYSDQSYDDQAYEAGQGQHHAQPQYGDPRYQQQPFPEQAYADPRYPDQSYGDQGYGQPAQPHPGQAPPPQPPPPSFGQQGYEQQGYEQQGYDQGNVESGGYEGGYEQTGMGGPPGAGRYEGFAADYDDQYGQPPPQQTFAQPQVGEPQPRRSRGGGGRTQGGAKGERDMPIAVGVGVGMAVLALGLLKVGPAATMVLVVAILGMASFEYFTATQRAGFDPLMPVGVVATVGAALAAYNYGASALPLVMVVSVAVCMIWYLIDAGGERPMANVGATLLGIFWVGMFGSFAALLLRGEGNLGLPNNSGTALLLAAVVPTVGYDIGALFVGRSAGNRPLSAASPNKTIEGLAGGMVLAVVGGLVLSFLGVDPFDSLGEGLKVGLVAALAAPLGDLSESLIKRDLGIKDMGSILPGHGGLLDRFDAMLFVLPAVYYVAVASDFFLA